MADAVDERLSGALQENILTALCFDSQHCRIIRATVRPQLFESKMYREVAGAAMDYLDQFGEPIGDHLADELEDVLQGDDARKASAYKRLLENLYAAREGVNGEYVVSQLQKFVRAQNVKSAIVEAVELIEDGRVDEAELAMQKGLRAQLTTFDPGINFRDPGQATAFLEHDAEPLLTGIEHLDRYGVGPARKTLYLCLAPTNRGKSWWLIHLGKWAMLQGKCVVHITLEMSAHKTAGRYAQAFFSISKHAGRARAATLVKNRGGEVIDIGFEDLARPSLQDPDIQAYIARRVKREFKRRPPLIIKEFPTGALTMQSLRAYLDNLERLHKITPDVVIVDYADLMSLDAQKKREELGELYKGLRGIAVERNLCMVTASQTNREGISSKVVDETHMSEDISKAFTADVVVSYNQTLAEHALQIARLYVAKNRDDEARMMCLITQAYPVGQFCLDSSPLMAEYWSVVAGKDRDEDED